MFFFLPSRSKLKKDETSSSIGSHDTQTSDSSFVSYGLFVPYYENVREG